jgi:hypothetical protein
MEIEGNNEEKIFSWEVKVSVELKGAGEYYELERGYPFL